MGNSPATLKTQYPDPPEDGDGIYTRWNNNRGESNFVCEVPPYHNSKDASQKPEEQIVCFVLHGMNSHCKESENWRMLAELSARGCYVFGIDHAGFGRSATDESRGHIEQWKYWIDDTVSFVESVMTKDKFQDHYFSLVGCSLGGAIALESGLSIQELKQSDPGATVWNRWLGNILYCPAIQQSIEPSWAEIQVLETLHNIGFKEYALGPSLEQSSYPTEEAFKVFNEDRYTYKDRMKLSFAFQAREMLLHVQSQLPNVAFPFIVFHGTIDDVVPFASSQALMEKSKTPPEDKTLITREDSTHFLIYHQKDIDEVFPISRKWLTDRIRGMNPF